MAAALPEPLKQTSFGGLHIQQALVPGRPAGPYREPNHSLGASAWPGKQAPTRQLSLFDASFKRPPEEQKRVDLTPSPTHTRMAQTRLTDFVSIAHPVATALDYPSSTDDDD